MNGRDVAEAFRERYPAAGVLYSSGHSGEVLNSRGTLGEDVALIVKPFRPSALAQQLREDLDSRK